MINTNDPLRVSRVPTNDEAQELTAVFSSVSGPPDQSYWEPVVSGDASVRILRQRSVFIIDRPQMPVDSDILGEIVVVKEDKKELRIELQTLDFYEDSLFQDVYGFAEASKKRSAPPLLPETYQRRGNRHYQRGEYTEALVAYNKAIELSPHVGLTYLLRGNVNAAYGLHQEAIGDYDKAEALIDQLSLIAQETVFFNRGNSKAELIDYHGALQDYTKAISNNPNLPHTHFNRGNTYIDLYRFDEALLDYDRITENAPEFAIFNRGNALLALGRLAGARHCYLDAVAKNIHHDGIAQNLRTLEQILLIVNDCDYTVEAFPDPDTDIMCLRFEMLAQDAKRRQSLNRFLFFGRQGNIGNTGGPGLSGGKGFTGKPFIRVYVNVRNEDGT